MSPRPATARRRRTADRFSLSNQLRDIIEARGLTAYALGKAADVDAAVIQRFLNGTRSITLETADRLAAALRVRLAEVSTRKVRRGPADEADDEATGDSA